jgi:hypothetical protein
MAFKLDGMTFGEGTGSEKQVPITKGNQRRAARKRRKADKLRNKAENLRQKGGSERRLQRLEHRAKSKEIRAGVKEDMAENLEAGKDKKADLVDRRGGQTLGMQHRVTRPKVYDEQGNKVPGTGKRTSDPVPVEPAEPKKEEPKEYGSFSEAYRAARDRNKAAGVAHYGDEKGYFTYKGKKYNTESRSEKAARLANK